MMIVPGSAFLPRVASVQAWDGFPNACNLSEGMYEIWEPKDGTVWTDWGGGLGMFTSASGTITLETRRPVENLSVTALAYIWTQVNNGDLPQNGTGEMRVYHGGVLAYSSVAQWNVYLNVMTVGAPAVDYFEAASGIVRIELETDPDMQLVYYCLGEYPMA
jgi:hypothetical protein